MSQVTRVPGYPGKSIRLAGGTQGELEACQCRCRSLRPGAALRAWQDHDNLNVSSSCKSIRRIRVRVKTQRSRETFKYACPDSVQRSL
eukprot:1502558-Rhodomonas_salina.2